MSTFIANIHSNYGKFYILFIDLKLGLFVVGLFRYSVVVNLIKIKPFQYGSNMCNNSIENTIYS